MEVIQFQFIDYIIIQTFWNIFYFIIVHVVMIYEHDVFPKIYLICWIYLVMMIWSYAILMVTNEISGVVEYWIFLAVFDKLLDIDMVVQQHMVLHIVLHMVPHMVRHMVVVPDMLVVQHMVVHMVPFVFVDRHPVPDILDKELFAGIYPDMVR